MKKENLKKFKEDINKIKRNLLRKNRQLMNHGDKYGHSCNCNKLQGIQLVLDRLKRHNILENDN